ncbi:uncharacterized protein [Rutidosis leptorrhynchoides]|uniref:uncharacterized protein n=1 Tax=Rutidosis leptorrhynchoides TaxID=125765 RepID=UPI003A98EB83
MTYDGQFLRSLTCCNDKIYAVNSDCFIGHVLIQVDIVPVKGKGGDVIIQLVMFGVCPYSESNRERHDLFIKGYDTELFCVNVYYLWKTKKIADVPLFRLDIGSIKSEELECLKKWDVSDKKWDIIEEVDFEELRDLGITLNMWEEMKDLKDGIFYADLGRDGSIYYNPTVGSELGGGGYIHIRDRMEEILHVYHVRDKTIIPSPMPSRVVSTTHVSMWEGTRLEDDDVEDKCTTTFKQ